MMDMHRRALMSAVLAGGVATSLPAWSRPRVRAARPGYPSGDGLVTGHPVVRVGQGQVRGYRRGRIDTFLGIPYGAPATGALRFMPPQPAASWNGTYDALSFGPGAPFMPPGFQPPGRGWGGPEDEFLLYRNWTPHVQSEDCLRLNVWAPSAKRGLPVMVYMHGGGLAAGSGNDLLSYDGHNLADRGDVVVVTHNHRLNVFGYLDLSSFGGRWSESSNLGMLDIVEVLRWIRGNIEAFGGDPGNVTIFGQSGGGAKVSALMAMPSAKGLFHRAIVQSGSPRMMGPVPRDTARVQAEKVLAGLGVDRQDLDKLATLPAEKIATANLAIGLGWSMSVGTSNLPVAPGEAGAAAQSVPLMVGTNLNEFVNGVDNPKARGFTEADLLHETEKLFGAGGRKIAEAYRKSYPGRPPFELFAAISTAPVREGAIAQAANNFAVTGKTWHYLFAWRTPVLGGMPGTFHSAEIAFVFNNAALCANQTGGGPEAVALAHRMSDAWTSFARTGKPDHAGLPAWPTFGSQQNTMVFDNNSHVVQRPEAEGRELIARSGSNIPMVPR